jgi:alpha-galactosidase
MSGGSRSPSPKEVRPSLFLRKGFAGAAIGSLVILLSLLGASKEPLDAGRGQSSHSTNLAPAPPMGWNSFDSYCGDVTEDEMRSNADYMAKHLANLGWKYVVVDYYWYYPHPVTDSHHEGDLDVAMDDYGRLLPATNRFPSAANGQGFKPLADYVHSRGLKFGIHIMRGIPRQAVKRNLPVQGTSNHAQDIANLKDPCSWSTAMYGVDTSKPAGRAYYDSIAKLYAHWGVDYIKADDMCWAPSPPAAHSYHGDEIEALSGAIAKSGRAMVLSLSPDRTEVVHAKHVMRYCQLWRISDDFWDNWKQLRETFPVCRTWAPYIGPNHWPDADMLPLGRIRIRGYEDGERHTRLTQDEQITMLTLWCIFRSPLMMGGDLPSLDRFTLSLLTNEEVLAVDQKSIHNREIFARGNQIAWAADIPQSKDKYLAVFNLGESPAEVAAAWSELGMNGKCSVRDLWEKKNLGTFERKFGPSLNPHGARVYRVSRAK